MKQLITTILAGSAVALAAEPTNYNEFAASPDFALFTINNLWICISAALVFVMHLGFASLEAGLCQRKNTSNIIFKNVWIISIGLVSYFFWGFNAHYPGDAWIIAGILPQGSIAGINPLGADAATQVANYTSSYADYTISSDFIFQGMFAATAATIVSGAAAERVKLLSFMIYATLLVTFGYTIAGSWHWGGGFLASLEVPFYDFAGSTVVHAFGGFAALAFIMVLGARHDKFTANGARPILPSNVPLANLGVFLLILGWFGFNGGSVLSADPQLVGHVFVTTALAAMGGAIGTMFTDFLIHKKPDVTMALNGFLAGLVGITAGADVISPANAILVGAIAGVIVVLSVMALEALKLDDPVGAVSVHGICGIWGTLAVAFFAEADLMSQLTGIGAVCAFAFIFSGLIALALKYTLGIRVDKDEELEGLDLAEHGSSAYN